MGERPDGRHGLPAVRWHPVSGYAPSRSGLDDPGKIRCPGHYPAGHPQRGEDIPLPIDHIPRTRARTWLTSSNLAQEVGYVFYLEPGPVPGTSVAYWGPEIKVGVPQPALNVNMDAHTNVESLSFSFDKEAKELPVVFIQNHHETAATHPDSRHHPAETAAGADATPAAQDYPAARHGQALAPASRAARAGLCGTARRRVTGTGSLDVLRYGRAVKGATTGRGARRRSRRSMACYYVKSVTHTIQRGAYKQRFTLSRNGLLSTVPRVPA